MESRVRSFFPRPRGRLSFLNLPLARHVAAWMGPGLIETGSKAISAGLCIAWLSKVDFGYASTAMLVFTYAALLQFGTTDALMLRLPGLYVQDDRDSIRRLLNTSMRFGVMNVVLLGFCFAAYFFISRGTDPRLVGATGAYLASAILYQIYTHYLLGNRYVYNLRSAALARLAIALFRFCVQLPATYFYGLWGYLIAEATYYLVPILVLRTKGGFALTLGWEMPELREILKVGFPLFLIALLGLASTTIDRWFVATVGGVERMAAFSAIAYLATIVMMLPNQVLSMFSQYAREMVAKEADQNDLYDRYLVFTILMVTAVGVGIFLVQHLGYFAIRSFWPHYAESLVLLSPVLVTCLVRSIFAATSNFSVIVYRQMDAFRANVVGAGVGAALCLAVVLRGGADLYQIAWATAVSSLLQAGYMVWMHRSRYCFDRKKLGLLVLVVVSFSGALLWGYSAIEFGHFPMGGYVVCSLASVFVYTRLRRWGDLSRIRAVANREF